ncbi:hypothetical protein U1Q18_006556, partial [Sarracenia purpurea var. burkii]
MEMMELLRQFSTIANMGGGEDTLRWMRSNLGRFRVRPFCEFLAGQRLVVSCTRKGVWGTSKVDSTLRQAFTVYCIKVKEFLAKDALKRRTVGKINGVLSLESCAIR